jgi:site-specific recombinase XerD
MSRQLLCASQEHSTIGNEQAWPLIAEFLLYLREAGMAEGSIPDFPGPAKHFLVWLGKKKISHGAVDIDIVRQFLMHKCKCQRPLGGRYQSRHMQARNFRAQVLRFVQFLEDSGRIQNVAALDEGFGRVDEFSSYLREQGYSAGTLLHYQRCSRHFVTWLRQSHIAFSDVDEAILERFAGHDCICPGAFVLKAERNRDYLFKIHRFVRFLAAIHVIPATSKADPRESDRLLGFNDWLRRHRGIGPRTILAHAKAIMGLLPQLGDDHGKYDAALLNRIMLEKFESTSRESARKMCGSLRMYLRFLAATGACPPALVGAIPKIPRWRLATLPRYILNDDVERVIASCDPTTPRGLRDRAILLLLARLALRGGDVANLDLHDIDWENALIRVSGKTRHTVALPMPQDVGNALLAYIEHARPSVDSSKVFIRVIAPFKPFSCSSPIGIVVRDALKRAGVENVNLRGAYLLRHSAATNMLRSGASLEAVGAVLRHRSPDTTTIYAKVDTKMLLQVAQPWIGRATCR